MKIKEMPLQLNKSRIIDSFKINNRIFYICICQCKKIYKRRSDLLNSNSCCSTCTKKQASTKHGMHKSKEYNIWEDMKDRCLNPNNKYYYNYGGRGIKICEAWKDFVNFFKDMGHCPKGHTLDRINNNKDYSLSNCKWSTRKEQMRNTRRNKVFFYKNKKRCIAEIAEINCIDQNALYCRLFRRKKKQSLQEAIAGCLAKK